MFPWLVPMQRPSLPQHLLLPWMQSSSVDDPCETKATPPSAAACSFSFEIWLDIFFEVQNTAVNCLGISLFLLNNAREDENMALHFIAFIKKKNYCEYWNCSSLGPFSNHFTVSGKVLCQRRNFQTVVCESPIAHGASSGGLKPEPFTAGINGLGDVPWKIEYINIYVYT